MKKKMLTIILITMTAISTIGCGSANKYAASDSAKYVNSVGGAYYSEPAETYDYYDEEAYSEDALVEYEESYPNAGSSSVTTTESATNTNRKLIRDVSLNVETKEYDSLIVNLENDIKTLGGYVEYMDVYNGSYNSGRQSRSANLTVRIPSNNLDSFISNVGATANITNKTESVRDITLTYVDTVSHKNMLVAEEERLVEMLKHAETIEDMIAVEDRLTEIRYQIDSMESQIRTYDNQVDYSTVSIYISEVITYTPVQTESKSTWERICEGFVENLIDIANDTKEFFINLIIDLPYIVISLIKLAIIILIIRFILRRFKKYRAFSDKLKTQRKEKKAAKKAARLAKKNGNSAAVQANNESDNDNSSTDNESSI